ncbi:hypothetical protein E2C01_095293 [Portunus trituberculatus]|uniref:Uncharacterized protein n=1 Tax=Portunus trituberculatus TaxID=210409 RepID=A0A5B7JPF8_PORTR|nr:hypothetical protein [Portunus trituberculatus]
MYQSLLLSIPKYCLFFGDCSSLSAVPDCLPVSCPGP